MDDQGFDFRAAPERRERKTFEVPPWEKEAFEESECERPARETAVMQETAPAVKEQRQGPTQAQMIEMLAGLAAEEGSEPDHVRTATLVVAIALFPLGLVMVMWGVAAFVKAGAAQFGAGLARFAGVTMLMFGIGFVVLSVVLVYRLMKQRGVL